MKMKILLAEDDNLLRKSLTFFLKKQDFEVTEATNGDEALTYIKNNGVDILITDLYMPGKGGLELIHTIRTQLNIDIPIIMLTASAIEKTETASFNLGASKFMKKPFSPNELLEAIKKLTDE